MTETQNVVLDRRTSGPHPAGYSSPGIMRIEKLVADDTRLHDEMYLDHDDGEWQTTYSLLNHMAKVAAVMEKIGRARQRSPEDIQLGRVAAAIHDRGKLDPECQNYRRKKRLSKEEKYVLTTLHAIYSARFVEMMMQKVRPEDRIFLGKVYTLVLHHHDPSKIADPELREIGYDLMFADIFVSIQEDRERPGLSLLAAIEFIDVLDVCAQDPQHAPHQEQIAESKRAIVWLFGLRLDDGEKL